MFILLSSAATPRYKQDILRCLAAPLGAKVQFRYAKKYVADNVLQEIQGRLDNTIPLGDGVVCFVNTESPGISPLYPVRKVLIESVAIHGSTLSLTLRMRGFAYADPTLFTGTVGPASGNLSPRKNEQGNLGGKYFFSIPDPGQGQAGHGVSVEETIAQWERIVEQLQGTPTFATEAFFWTVLGMGDPAQKVSRDETFRTWNENLKPDVYRSLLIYHYRPQSGDVPDAKLAVKVGGPLESGSPEVIEIDSRYDLKRWFFRTESRDQVTHYGWIRIRANDTWDLDLPALMPGSWFSLVGKALLAGTFIAGPAVATAIGRHSDQFEFTLGGQPHWGLCAEISFSLFAGWVAAFLVLFYSGVPRVRS